jgi:hypothetical protein
MLILGWFTNHFYLHTIANEKVFNLNKYYPQIPLVIGTMGGMLLMGNTATIDTGKMNGKWHGACASNFFIFTLVAQLYNTFICAVMHSKIKTINTYNLYFKYLLLGLLIFQLVLSSYGEVEIDSELDSDLGKLLEWTLTATVIMGFYSISLDCEKF